MTHHLKNLGKWFCDRFGRRDGMVSAEFVIMFPVAMLVFLVAGETTVVNLRKTDLDSALEATIRELRLGQIANPTVAELRSRICTRLGSPDGCTSDLTLELNVRSTALTTMTTPSLTAMCVNRATDVDPVLTFDPGVANDLVLVRACYVVDVYFETSIGDLSVAEGVGDEHQLISTTAYVNEPK